MPAKPTTVDDYLARLPADQREALEKLRRTIRLAAPDAEECISYQLPAFRRNGMLVGFGATAKHCAFHLMSSSTVEAHAEDLAKYDTSKGTIRFSPAKPLPATLVRKLVCARLAENEALRGSGKPYGGGKKKAAKLPESNPSRIDAAVDELLRGLEHPLKAEIEAVRRILLDVDPAISEAVKWNAPSYRTTEFFATVNLRSRDELQIVLHRGAKVRADSKKTAEIPAPAGMIQWLGPDRCLATLGSGERIEANRAAFSAFIREWIRHV